MKKLVLLCTAILASNAVAEEAKSPWKVSSEIGVILTSGNTETTTLKAGINAKHKLEKWSNEYKLNAIYKEDEVSQNDGTKETQRTNEKYSASAQGNYALSTKHSHLFVLGSYVSDYFGAYRNESLISAGYGKRFIDKENMTFDAEIGPGYKSFEYAKGTVIGSDTDNEIIGLGKVNFNWNITDYAEFNQLVQIETGSTNTKTTFETYLLTKINGSMQMKVGFNVTNNSDVAVGKEKTDQETILTLVYNF